MPKHIVVILVFVLSLLTLLFLPSLFDAIFAFIFVGIIPFTTVAIPPLVMMPIYAALLVLCVHYLTKQSLINADPAKREEAGRKRARKQVYKKTAPKKSSGGTVKSTRPKKRYQTASNS